MWIQNLFTMLIPSDPEPVTTDLSERIKEEMMAIKARNVGAGNSDTRFAIAKMDREIATATGFIEMNLRRELKRLTKRNLIVSYGISLGSHSETICQLHLRDRENHNFDEVLYWYVFRDTRRKLRQFVTKQNILDGIDGTMEENIEILTTKFQSMSSGVMAVDLHNIIDKILDDIMSSLNSDSN